MGEPTYRIVRRFFGDSSEPRIIRTGLTREEAQRHCKDPETSSKTAKGAAAVALTNELGQWMDGFEQESPGDYSPPAEPNRPGSRRVDLSFPECLMVREGLPKGRMLDWTHGHNAAIKLWISAEYERQVNPLLFARKTYGANERAILGLALGIETWCSNNPSGATDGYGSVHVVEPLFQAFKEALNYDTGRLDCGTLGEWADDRLRSLGINPETYERI